MPTTDWLVAAIVALTPVLVAVLKWALAQVDMEIPSLLKPIIATAAGSAIAYLMAVQTSDPVLIAVIGLATVGLREIVDQFGQKLGLVKK